MTDVEFNLALPNKGRLSHQVIDFLRACSLNVRRENERQYQARMSGINAAVNVIFQRVRDIPKLVEESKADLGITGFDVYCEAAGETRENLVTVFPDAPEERQVDGLPFGQCDLVLAVPDHWADITSLYDLIELAIRRKREGKLLRVATEFPYLTRNFLLGRGISYFQIIEVYGAAENAPKMGSADIVADLKSSGVTLKENRLKVVDDGTILRSSACLIASKERLTPSDDPGRRRLAVAQALIERIEAHLKAKKYYLVTANIDGDGMDELETRLKKDLAEEDLPLLGQEGPTVAHVLPLRESETPGRRLFSVSIQICSKDLERVIDVLRRRTGRHILVSPIHFVYDAKSTAYSHLLEKLDVRRRKKKRGADAGKPKEAAVQVRHDV